MGIIFEQYEQRVARGDIRTDTQQIKLVEAFDALLSALSNAEATASKGLLGLFRSAPVSVGGIYVWGDVGRGKSMLMDLFVEAVQHVKKTRRVHFHAFMREVHKALFTYRKQEHSDALKRVITDIARNVQVLCLDEFQVTDVADAMILSRLFSGLMDANITCVFTSNRAPRDLYQGGLQRDQFLKFAALLETRVRMITLNGPTDYRLAQLKSLTRSYMYPRDGDADDFLLSTWQTLTAGAPTDPLKIEIDGRVLRVDKHAKGIAWFTFGELCMRPLGANDYLEIAQDFHTLLLQGIPQMKKEDRNEAKRFVTLIDALYDYRVKLIATAAAAPEDLYPAGDGAFEFARTASRLIEMQSETYWQQPHGRL